MASNDIQMAGQSAATVQQEDDEPTFPPYEGPAFLSYGFRPKRSCHDAVKDLREHLFKEEVEVVIDVDLANFFGAPGKAWCFQ